MYPTIQQCSYFIFAIQISKQENNYYPLILSEKEKMNKHKLNNNILNEGIRIFLQTQSDHAYEIKQNVGDKPYKLKSKRPGIFILKIKYNGTILKELN